MPPAPQTDDRLKKNCKALTTLATVAKTGDCRRKRRLSPNSASRQCGQGIR